MASEMAGAPRAPASGPPNCKTLLPQANVEEVMGGAVTLQLFGRSDFIRNALTPGTTAGTDCVYGTTDEMQNDF